MPPRQLLDYFGQNGAEPCGNCDTCLTPPESWDGTVPAQKVLSTVLRLPRERRQKFGVGPDRRHPARQDDRQGAPARPRLAERVRGRRRAGRRRVARGGAAAAGPGPAGGRAATTARWCSPTPAPKCCAASSEVPLRRDARAARPRRQTRRGQGAPPPPPTCPRRRRRCSSACAPGGPPPPRSRASPPTSSSTTRPCARSPPLSPTTLAELGTVNGVGENKLAKYGEQVLETLAGEAA